MAPHSSPLAWKTPGRRSLEGCSPWGRWGSDTTERLPFHFSLSCIREGNGNPLQCSCLENPRDRGAWWAAVYVVAQSQTRLKRLSSSSSSKTLWCHCVLDLSRKCQRKVLPSKSCCWVTAVMRYIVFRTIILQRGWSGGGGFFFF